MSTQRWSGTLLVEGERTIDGRYVENGATWWDEHDMPLRLTLASSMVPVGTIDKITREGNLIRGEGRWLGKPPPEKGLEAGLTSMEQDYDDEAWEESRTLVTKKGQLRYVALGERPVWPQCHLDEPEVRSPWFWPSIAFGALIAFVLVGTGLALIFGGSPA